MRKTYIYRMNGNKTTFNKAIGWLDLCRILYNTALEQRILGYKYDKRFISYLTQKKQLPEFKNEFIEYKQVDAQVLQDVLKRLDRAYRGFYKRVKNNDKPGFPRFKGRGRYNSFTLCQNSWQLDSKYLTILKVGTFKLRLSRPIEGIIKTITIRRTPTNKWYACFSCDKLPKKLLPYSNKVVGLDVGIKSFLVDSEGNSPVENPRYLKHSLKELRVRQRKLARAKKGSNRRKDAKLLLSKCYEKIANQRSDFQHKLANEYIRNYGLIVFEKLQIRNMVKNHHLARDINDCAWGQFFGYLDYKAEYAGRLIFKDNPRNTSKMCHACGVVNKDLKLSDRIWICQECGTLHDRDFNAAVNHKNEGIKYLERLGQSHQELTYENAQRVF